MLTKQRVIMHRGVTTSDYTQWFCEPSEHLRNIVMLCTDWADMGSPEILTVTIEPGDLLNDDPISR